MAHPEGRGPAESQEFETEARWRSAGDRIQVLLDATATGGPVAARERAESLVAELTDLYGAGMHRMMSIAAATDPVLIERFAADDLVASLMLVHDLHPHGVERRIEDALDSVRPYLGSHGGDVTLLDVVDGAEGPVVRLAFAGSCKSCPSSAVTLELTVEDAVRAAAPEISSIEVVAAEADSTSGVIPVESLMSRVHTRDSPGTAWHPVPDIADLASGEVGGFMVAGVTVLACRIGDDLFAYHDRCGSCEQSLAGAVLHRRMGTKIGEAVLRCPQCHAHFDAVHAGASLDDAAGVNVHLDPLPLLVRDGVLSLAVLAETTGVT
jgi:Fe-S cluster biogenesis protein NfuA/nitrite reductase/ring-hydroxylating ferredoxin subunit